MASIRPYHDPSICRQPDCEKTPITDGFCADHFRRGGRYNQHHINSELVQHIAKLYELIEQLRSDKGGDE